MVQTQLVILFAKYQAQKILAHHPALLLANVNQRSIMWIRLAIATIGVLSLDIVEIKGPIKKALIVEIVKIKDSTTLAQLPAHLLANVNQDNLKWMKKAIATIGVLNRDIVEIKGPIEEMVSTVETAKDARMMNRP